MPGMMDKGSEYLGKGRSNGTKSPSNASNGHFSDESGSDDEHGIASNTPAEVVYAYWNNTRSLINTKPHTMVLVFRCGHACGIRLSS